MTYLELCRALRRECGVSGTSTTPSAVTSQTGEMLRLVNWIKDAWIEIQGRHSDWRWMRRAFTVNTVLGDGVYTYGDCTDVDAAAPITRFGQWWAHDIELPFTTYLQSTGVGGERDLPYIDWAQFRYMYRRGTQNNNVPSYVSVDPGDQLVIGPKPDGVYVVNGDYQRSAQILAVDDDTPEIPTQYHMLIVYEAMKKYAGYEAAAEVYDRGNEQATKLMRQLEANQKTQIRLAPPLA